MRLIDEDKVENFFKTIRSRAYFKYNPQAKEGAELIMDYIRKLDTIDPESLRPKAKWKDVHGGFLFECSNCHAQTNSILFKSNLRYCPNCGAKMDLGEGEANGRKAM